MPLPDNKLVFSSNRNGHVPTKGFTNPTLQLFVMDVDGSNIHDITPMTNAGENAASLYDIGGDNAGPRVGKYTHPLAAPDNDLLVVWTPGPANDLNRPTPIPYYDAGLYIIANSGLLDSFFS